MQAFCLERSCPWPVHSTVKLFRKTSLQLCRQTSNLWLARCNLHKSFLSERLRCINFPTELPPEKITTVLVIVRSLFCLFIYLQERLLNYQLIQNYVCLRKHNPVAVVAGSVFNLAFFSCFSQDASLGLHDTSHTVYQIKDYHFQLLLSQRSLFHSKRSLRNY